MNTPVAISWSEPHQQRAATRIPDSGTVPILGRGLTLDVSQLPAGDYYAWVACESLTAKALRAQLIADHGANPKWIRAAGYWRAGAVAVHDTFTG